MINRTLLARLRAALSRLRPTLSDDKAAIRRSLATRLPAWLIKDVGGDP